MSAPVYPHAVRLIGFSPEDTDEIATVLADAPGAGPGYVCLLPDSLQEPDLYLANGADIKALTALAAVPPSELQPAVVIGACPVVLPCTQLDLPIDPGELFGIMDQLMARRVEVLSQLPDGGSNAFPERRRRERLDFDLTDQADYEARRQAPPRGAVLIIDQGAALRDHVVKLLEPRKLSVEWTDNPTLAVRLCEETPVSLVLVNTSTPGIEPYALCAAIKALPDARRIAVIFLVSAAFGYDSARARSSGVRGLLDKPIADRHMLSTLKRMLSLAS